MMAQVKTFNVSRSINFNDFSMNYKAPLQKFETWCRGREFEDGVTVCELKAYEYLQMCLLRGNHSREDKKFNSRTILGILYKLNALWKVGWIQ